MRVRWWHSLRLRIAAVIFLLEAVLLGVVLWQTQDYTLEKARQLIQAQDQIALDLLAEDARQALFTLEFDVLSDLFERAATNSHIRRILLVDDRGVVVASNDAATLGRPPPPVGTESGTYQRTILLRNPDGNAGTLQVVFSANRLQRVHHESLRLGIAIGLTGMLLIAFAGISLGHVLTRRLTRLTHYAENIARGRRPLPIDVGGRDEVRALNHAINTMVESLRRQASSMKRLAYRDSLTGLANRPAFHERLQQVLESARRHHQRSALLYLDLDQFKVVNDTCGHDAGDRLLIELAKVLEGRLRSRDTLARLGGDEFGVLLDRVSLEEAIMVAEKLRQAVDEFRLHVDGRVFHVGVSIGVVEIDEDSPDVPELLSLADMACYAAKEKGRNAIEVASDDEASREQMRLMAWVPELQAVLEEQRFELLRQRVAKIEDTNEVVGWEFLLRLRTRDGRLLSPDQFIDAAERYQLMPRIDREVVRLVCETVTRHPEAYPGRLFINLSGLTLADEDFMAYVQKLLRANRIDTERLCFEIKESTAINRIGTLHEFIQRMQACGCHICLDDFGSGLCNFHQLDSLSIDHVKIRGEIIQEMLRSPLDARIVQAMIDITQAAGLHAIAKQVETPAQLERLRELGVEMVQGTMVHPPESTF